MSFAKEINWNLDKILYNLYTGFIQYSSCKLKEIFKGNQRRFADCVFLSVSRF